MALDYSTFTLDEWANFTLDQWAAFLIDPAADYTVEVQLVAVWSSGPQHREIHRAGVHQQHLSESGPAAQSIKKLGATWTAIVNKHPSV